jgi:hypothetical protein
VRERARVRYIRRHELEPFRYEDHDDDEGTDHLARLGDERWLARVIELLREQGGRVYGISPD